ncbi:hypothetical protein Ndes2526B_g05442 [Nannochloris sp. 'desiccata']
MQQQSLLQNSRLATGRSAGGRRAFSGLKASAAKGKKPSTPVEILKQENELLKKTIAATDATVAAKEADLKKAGVDTKAALPVVPVTARAKSAAAPPAPHHP